MSVGVGRIFESVCLSVCPQHNSKTNDPKVFKLFIVNAQYFPNVKAYEVQTRYTERPVSATSAVISKVKGQGRKVT